MVDPNQHKGTGEGERTSEALRTGLTVSRVRTTMGKTSTEAKNRWNAKAYDRLSLVLPKGMRDEFKAACAERGTTINAVFRDAVEQFLQETPKE